MIRPDFIRFLRGLCDHFDAPDLKPERLDTTFQDTKHLSADVLGPIAEHIRHNHEFFPKNLTKAMLDAYELVKRGIPAKREDKDETPIEITPEELEANDRRAKVWFAKISALTSNIKAPYLSREGRNFGHNEPDAYHRARRGR